MARSGVRFGRHLAGDGAAVTAHGERGVVRSRARRRCRRRPSRHRWRSGCARPETLAVAVAEDVQRSNRGRRGRARPLEQRHGRRDGRADIDPRAADDHQLALAGRSQVGRRCPTARPDRHRRRPPALSAARSASSAVPGAERRVQPVDDHDSAPAPSRPTPASASCRRTTRPRRSCRGAARRRRRSASRRARSSAITAVGPLTEPRLHAVERLEERDRIGQHVRTDHLADRPQDRLGGRSMTRSPPLVGSIISLNTRWSRNRASTPGRLEEVEGVAARRRVDHDQVEALVAVQLVEHLGRHVLLRAAQRAGDVAVEPVAEDPLGLLGVAGVRRTSPSNVAAVSSIIAHSSPPASSGRRVDRAGARRRARRQAERVGEPLGRVDRDHHHPPAARAACSPITRPPSSSCRRRPSRSTRSPTPWRASRRSTWLTASAVPDQPADAGEGGPRRRVVAADRSARRSMSLGVQAGAGAGRAA